MNPKLYLLTGIAILFLIFGIGRITQSGQADDLVALAAFVFSALILVVIRRDYKLKVRERKYRCVHCREDTVHSAFGCTRAHGGGASKGAFVCETWNSTYV